MFERIRKKCGEGVVKMLTIQYRMNELISNWSSQEMYNNKLKSDESVKKRLLRDLPKVKENDDTKAALLFIDTAGCNMNEAEADADDSKFNEGEAE